LIAAAIPTGAEGSTIEPLLPNRPQGVPQVDDRQKHPLALLHLLPIDTEKMVVDAVWCERVSRPVSLLYAKKTGKIAEKRGHLPGSTRKSGGFSPLFARACQIGTGNLRSRKQGRAPD
jgi:hypothetical protein